MLTCLYIENPLLEYIRCPDITWTEHNVRPLSKVQPDFGPQHIKSSDELKPGLLVETVFIEDQTRRHRGEQIGRIVGIGLRFDWQEGFVEDPRYWTMALPDGRVVSHFLTDDGFAPYTNSGWNACRYMRRVEDKQPIEL